MIDLTDLTLNEAKGDYKEVCKLMQAGSLHGGNWMLISDVSVTTTFITSNFRLHFWKNGTVVIHDTDHPLKMDISDDDFRELSQWCKNNDWTELKVDDRLLENRIALDFWTRVFISGLVGSDTLKKNEEEEMERIMKSHVIEKEQEDAS